MACCRRDSSQSVGPSPLTLSRLASWLLSRRRLGVAGSRHKRLTGDRQVSRRRLSVARSGLNWKQSTGDKLASACAQAADRQGRPSRRRPMHMTPGQPSRRRSDAGPGRSQLDSRCRAPRDTRRVDGRTPERRQSGGLATARRLSRSCQSEQRKRSVRLCRSMSWDHCSPR